MMIEVVVVVMMMMTISSLVITVDKTSHHHRGSGLFPVAHQVSRFLANRWSPTQAPAGSHPLQSGTLDLLFYAGG